MEKIKLKGRDRAEKDEARKTTTAPVSNLFERVVLVNDLDEAL
jgi:hypothetical protein